MSDSPYVLVPDGFTPPIMCLSWEGGRNALPLGDIPNQNSYLVQNGRCKKILLVQDGVVVDENYQDTLIRFEEKRKKFMTELM